MHVHIHTHIFTYTYLHTHTYISTYTYTYVQIHIHIHMHRHIHRHKHWHRHIYISHITSRAKAATGSCLTLHSLRTAKPWLIPSNQCDISRHDQKLLRCITLQYTTIPYYTLHIACITYVTYITYIIHNIHYIHWVPLHPLYTYIYIWMESGDHGTTLKK
jgi:hypothetical protein